MFATARLQALDAVATHRTVGRAAAALHLTPSAVSQQLTALEREAGAPLTERDGRGLRLTPAGRLLAGHATEVLARLRLARSQLDRRHDEVVGTVRVGAIPTSVHALAPAAMSRLRAAHPELRVTLADGESPQTLPAVLADDLDVAVVENWPGLPAPVPAGTARRELVADDVVDLALPATHRLAGRRRVSLGEVDDVPWVVDRPDNRSHDWMLHVLRTAGVEPDVLATVCGWGMHLDLVAGTGVAALVPRLARPAAPAGVVMVATDPVYTRSVDAVWRADRESPAVRAVVDALAAVGRERARD